MVIPLAVMYSAEPSYQTVQVDLSYNSDLYSYLAMSTTSVGRRGPTHRKETLKRTPEDMHGI